MKVLNMKAFIINSYNKKAELEFAEIPTPSLNENEILVEIHAAGVNLLDSKIKAGEFKLILPYQLPLVLGHDVAGVVTKVGRKVTRFKEGDEIFARPADYHIGAFAEYIAINESDAALKPKNISMEEAASIPLVGLTAWQAIVESGKLKKGQKIFIQAGSGGVGTIAIQLAKHIGATVATTGSEASANMLLALGADVFIDYKKQDFEQVLQGYDLVLNSQDKKTLEKSFNITRAGGKVISISGPPTPEFAKSIGAAWFVKIILSLLSLGVRKKAQRKSIDYSFLFMRAEGRQLQQITALIESGIIKPVVDKVFSFSETNDALRYVESGRVKGKVVIKIK